tara:strand:- start:428 stop:709 length:282 start_codon:yes stop_codon:yes gene_type:complete
MAQSTLFFKIVGLQHYGSHQFTHTDENKIKFKKEETNQYDSNAIKVLLENKHVGYISKNDNKKVLNFIKIHDTYELELFVSNIQEAVFILKQI